MVAERIAECRNRNGILTQPSPSTSSCSVALTFTTWSPIVASLSIELIRASTGRGGGSAALL